MKWKAFSGITLALFLIGMLGVAFKVQRVEASGTIYIRADGSVEGTTHISSDDNVTYTFDDDIYDEIVVERSNITIDGDGYALQGPGSGIGFYLSDINNVTITQTSIKGFTDGVYLTESSNNRIFENNMMNNENGLLILHYSSINNSVYGNNLRNNTETGIFLVSSSYNNISNNYLTDNRYGIELSTSDSNCVAGNNLINNTFGIGLVYSSDNIFYHNNFIKGEGGQVYDPNIPKSINVWDDGYPSGGNYWSDYTGVDLDPDGIGDTSYDIDENNRDNYPLRGMFSDFNATSEQHVQTICNSSISDFIFNGTAICFNVTGEDSTTGLCRICIPRALMNETYKVFVNGTEVPCNLLPCSNSIHSYLYFTYDLSTQEVIIIPEFPTWASMLLILIVLTFSIVIYKRRLLKTPKH